MAGGANATSRMVVSGAPVSSTSTLLLAGSVVARSESSMLQRGVGSGFRIVALAKT
jgi:hypothetical protein